MFVFCHKILLSVGTHCALVKNVKRSMKLLSGVFGDGVKMLSGAMKSNQSQSRKVEFSQAVLKINTGVLNCLINPSIKDRL